MVETYFKIVLLVWLGCAAIVPFLADVKGRHAGLWSLLALVFGPLVVLVLLLLRRNQISYAEFNLGCSSCVKAIERGEAGCNDCDREFDLKQIDLAKVRKNLKRARGNVLASILFGLIVLNIVVGSYFLPSFGN